MYYGENVSLFETKESELNSVSRDDVLSAIARMAKLIESQTVGVAKYIQGSDGDSAKKEDSARGAVAGAALDFRVSEEAQQNLFYVDAGNTSIGYGTNTPSSTMTIANASDQNTLTISANDASNVLTIKDHQVNIDGTMFLNKKEVVTEDRLAALLDEIKSVVKENDLLKKFSKALMERSGSPSEAQDGN